MCAVCVCVWGGGCLEWGSGKREPALYVACYSTRMWSWAGALISFLSREYKKCVGAFWSGVVAVGKSEYLHHVSMVLNKDVVVGALEFDVLSWAYRKCVWGILK